MSTARVRMRRWAIRSRMAPVRIDVRESLVLLACVVAVLALFFEVGRMTRSTSSNAAAYGPQRLPAVSVHAGIPSGLITAPAIPTLVAAQAPAAEAPSSSSRVVGTSSPTSTAAGSTVTPGASETVRPEPAPTPTPTPTPTPAPTRAPSAPAPQPHSSPHSSGEGGSFDSSG